VRALAAIAVSGCLAGACQATSTQAEGPEASNSATDVALPGVDTSSLTGRERREWSAFVAELPAPCPDQPVTVKQCVREARPCRACVPAAKFLFSQVRLGKSRSQVEETYLVRFAPDRVRQLEVGGSAWKGAKHPTVLIVEWADFQCSACAATARFIDAMVKTYPDHVRVVYKHFPLARHPFAEQAARAAVAAAKQGKFWLLHDLMYQSEQQLDDANLRHLAQQAGLDLARFEQDRADAEVAKVVARDRQLGDALELSGTPLIYVNGRHFDLNHFSVAEDLAEWVRTEIEIKTGHQVSSPAVQREPERRAAATPRAVGSSAAAAASPSEAQRGAVPRPSRAVTPPAPAPSAGAAGRRALPESGAAESGTASDPAAPAEPTGTHQ
jgi:hypothetical protein